MLVPVRKKLKRADIALLPVKFAVTSEGMTRVYATGPPSCLSNKASYYLSAPMHPIAVLAAGDIEVAYLENDTRVLARTLVWRKKYIYLAPIYGDWGSDAAVVLEEKLFKLGLYEARRGDFDGARLLRCPVTIHPPKQEHDLVYGLWPCWCFSCQVFRLGKPVHTFIAPGIDCDYNGFSVGEDYLYIGKIDGLPRAYPDHDKGVLL